ncbi:DUF992 domain-containing protein [Amorphus coralli]|uniref:DUF992 domain-containing protein n=1 Tax=Amorphus coralli TaxID=340680 RepID=UPI00036360BE|nr:DUF992 domain-containing protein [Amorphus coralli]
MIKTAVAAAAMTVAIGAAAPAVAQERAKVGVLECTIAGGSGFVFGSTKQLTCVYTPVGSGATQTYTGTINKYGIDIGKTQQSEVVWGVLAAGEKFDPNMLEGKYVGATAEATAGVGLGANALVGGFERSVALNPISVQAQTGVNIAAGVAELTLAGTN